jgi:ammonia channel protein AmtB
MWLSWATKRMKIDDPLDAFAVHFGGGLVGILSTPVFMNGGIVHWQNCESQRANYMLVVLKKNKVMIILVPYFPLQILTPMEIIDVTCTNTKYSRGT